MSRILLVDDDVSVCSVAQLALEDEGHHITVAHDGQEGMQKALEENFDLIISDLMMPKMDGLMMLTRLRRAQIEAPALLSTSLPEENLTIFPPKPYDAYLGKPYVIDDLVTSVDKLLHIH
jgi:CheY-like chemotaxis protein